MFGHDDEDKKTDDAVTVEPATDAPADSTATDTSNAPADGAPAVDGSADSGSSDSSSTEEETPLITSTGTPDPAPSEQTSSDAASTETTAADIDTSGSDDTAPVFSDSESSDSSSTSNDDELLNLKKDAIDELAPLLDQLDQSPEEKFKTTMMMIQATDSSNLVKVAHAAAKEITDEKVRAQALLDIVNEINYFTHKD